MRQSKEELAAKKKIYYILHRTEILARVKARRDETRGAYQKEYLRRPGIKERVKERMKAYRQQPENKERIEAQRKAYTQRPEFKEKQKRYSKEYAQRPEFKVRRQSPEHKAYMAIQNKKYNTSEKGKARYQERYLQKNYGLTPTEKAAMLEKQGGRCANRGCGASDTKEHPLHVDHDKMLGQVRGLLCGNCNRAYGLLKESVCVIKGLAQYGGRVHTWWEKDMPPKLREICERQAELDEIAREAHPN